MNDRNGLAMMVTLTCVLASGIGCIGHTESTEVAANDPLPRVPHATEQGSSGPLTAAHAAYLRGDYESLGENVRDVLLEPGSTKLAKQNALELFDAAYRVKNGALPSRFTPPPGVSGLQYAVRRFASPHGPYYQVRFAGVARNAADVVGVTLRRLPDETLMDKESGKGTFSVRHDPSVKSRGLEEFVIDSEPLDVPPADGVISIRLETQDGTVSEGFVVAHGLAIEGAPVVTTPEAAATVSEPNPVVRWAPFAVTQHVPFERTRVGMHVRRDDDGPSLWEYATTNKEGPAEVRIGVAGVGPKISLAPGSYWLDLSAVESRFFGPVEVLRASRVSQPFQVVRP